MFAPAVPRQSGHAAKQARWGTPNEPDVAIAFDPQSDAMASRADFPLAPGGEGFGVAACERKTIEAERTGTAARLLGTAVGGTEIHECLDNVAWQLVLHHREERTLDVAPRRRRPSIEPRDHPFDVGVDGRRFFVEGDRCDRSRGVSANAGEVSQIRSVCRKSAARGDLASAGNQVARPGVIAKSGPF